MKRRSLLLGSAALLAGCGGGSSALRGRGKAVFTIEWPKATTRLIPVASNSLTVEIRQADVFLARKIVNRPQTTIEFELLPEGNIEAIASAFPQQNGVGVALATGFISFEIIDNQSISVPLKMTSAIRRFSIAPAQITVNSSRRLIARALNGDGVAMLVDPNQFDWEYIGSASQGLWDAKKFIFTALQIGEARFRITDRESGVQAETSLSISSSSNTQNSYLLPPYDGSTNGTSSLGQSFSKFAIDKSNYIIWVQGYDNSSECIYGIDPDTGTIISKSLINSSINSLALSHDDSHLFVSTYIPQEVIRIRISDMQRIESIPGTYTQICLKGIPGSSTTICTYDSIFDGLIRRPNQAFINMVNQDNTMGYHYRIDYSPNWKRATIDSSGMQNIQDYTLSIADLGRIANNDSIFTISMNRLDPINLTIKQKMQSPLSGYTSLLQQAIFRSTFPEIYGNVYSKGSDPSDTFNGLYKYSPDGLTIISGKELRLPNNSAFQQGEITQMDIIGNWAVFRFQRTVSQSNQGDLYNVRIMLTSLP